MDDGNSTSGLGKAICSFDPAQEEPYLCQRQHPTSLPRAKVRMVDSFAVVPFADSKDGVLEIGGAKLKAQISLGPSDGVGAYHLLWRRVISMREPIKQVLYDQQNAQRPLGHRSSFQL